MSTQPSASHEFTNRLAGEASPYLLQHAHNPVDWWPWGPEAIAEARRRDIPIFLSIGYSTCYWCHVMERESFESRAIAAIMNERFVCVKVDREQRPDLDEIYMAATQIMTGHGGWPMSVFIEPASLKPFYCGTYWPAEPRAGMGQMPTFPRVLDVMSTLWRDERGEVVEQAASLGEAVALHLASQNAPAPLGVETVQGAASVLLRMFDRQHGGFGAAPKFPQPVYLDLLLDIRERAGDDATRAALDQAIRHTLDRMAIGGMRDQVGGGFHRYSVDATWTVPHFEKMLYDNAMLAEVYARAGLMYGDDYYRGVARSTIGYVLREMTRREAGGLGDAGAALAFYTAQDAEVDHREGLNYLWTPETMRGALEGKVERADIEWALEVFGVSRGANFRDPHHPEDAPASVLRLDARPEGLAARMGLSAEEFERRMSRVCGVLLAARDERKQPHLDDKAILSWNALMVRSLAACAASDPSAPESREWLASAFGVARWLLGTMRAEDGTLVRVWRQGRAQTGALLEDYAAMTRALVTLVHTPGASEGDAAWALGEARVLIAEAQTLFGDGAGGFHDTREGATDLFVRSRATYDGAMPSGPGLMALALAELAVRTREAEDVERAVGAIASISGAISENPVGSAVGTRALLTMLREPGLAGGRLGFDETGARMAEGAGVAGAGGTGAGGTGAGLGAAAALDFTPVEVFAPEERLVVKLGEPASLRLLVRVAPGYHVVAADPGGEVSGLVAFRVEVMDAGAAGDGGERAGGRAIAGLSAYADYPAGSEFAPSALAGAIRVYEGEFELLVVLERGEGVRAGSRPMLVVTFQACTATECLRPQRLELDVAIDMP